MSELDSWMHQKKRNKVKKELRKTKPYLMGARLDAEVDRMLGIVESGRMAWIVAVEETKPALDYPKPDEIGYQEIVEVADKYHVRAYQLYWYYLQKVDKLKSTGNVKRNYYALLTECAVKAGTKGLDDAEKMMAGRAYATDILKIPITDSQLQAKIIMGEL